MYVFTQLSKCNFDSVSCTVLFQIFALVFIFDTKQSLQYRYVELYILNLTRAERERERKREKERKGCNKQKFKYELLH